MNNFKGQTKRPNKTKNERGITLVALIITIILHYYYGMKYSNSNGFLKAIV